MDATRNNVRTSVSRHSPEVDARCWPRNGDQKISLAQGGQLAAVRTRAQPGGREADIRNWRTGDLSIKRRPCMIRMSSEMSRTPGSLGRTAGANSETGGSRATTLRTLR